MVSFAKAFHKCMNVESVKAKFFIKGNPCHLVTLRKAGQWCSRRHSTEQRSLWWEAALAQGSSENPPKKLCGSLRETDVPVWAPSHWQLQQEWRRRRRSRQSPWSPQGGRPGCVETDHQPLHWNHWSDHQLFTWNWGWKGAGEQRRNCKRLCTLKRSPKKDYLDEFDDHEDLDESGEVFTIMICIDLYFKLCVAQ